MHPSYGPPIVQPGALEFLGRIKNRALAAVQGAFLRAFAAATLLPPLDRVLARASRRLLGAFLYSVKLEVNTACELHCRMCYVRERGPELPLDVILKVLDDLRGLGTRLEILGGEPLQRAELPAIVAHAKRIVGIPVVSVFTNGTRASPELAAELAAAGLDAALVTLVSHRREIHDAFTGQPASWERAVAGIASLREAGVRAYTFTAIHRENAGHWREVARFAREELGVSPVFYQYVAQRRNDSLALAADEWNVIQRHVLHSLAPAHERLVRHFCMLTGDACSGGNFVLTVKADGSVQPCPFVDDLALGSVYSESLWSIWRKRFASPAYRELKRVPLECLPCTYVSVCGGGCRAANPSFGASYASRDPRCLGPFSSPLRVREVMDHVPTFF
ncbi:MAG: radical SAM protein [Acidobacteriota bacterium]